MTVEEACRLPKGTRIQRHVGHSDLTVLSIANFHCTHQHGSLLTMERMGEVRLMPPPGQRHF